MSHQDWKTSVAAVALVCVGADRVRAYSSWGTFDRIATPSIASATNCQTGLAAWTAAASPTGTIHTADMESFTPGTSGNTFILDTGVTMQFIAGGSGGTMHVRNTAPSDPKYGFNTTTGGSQHLEMIQTTQFITQPKILFTFSQPIQAFSFMLTGEGLGSSLLFDYGLTFVRVGGLNDPDFGLGDLGQPYWPTYDQPNARFGGYVDPGGSVTTVEISLKYPSTGTQASGTFSIDDVRWVPSPIPGPGVVTIAIIVAPMVAKRRLRPISLTTGPLR